jgi:SanA protein
MKYIFKIVKLILWSISIVIAFSVLSNVWIIFATHHSIKNNVEDVAENSVCLVLGTSKKVVGGKANPYFDNRIIAAAELYKSGKVKQFILSGDNRTRYYNEPQDMKKALMKHGIPEEVITLDYAGLRTLDSILRCKEIFGQNRIVIVTQKFHSYRAVFISQYYKIDAQAFTAQNIPLGKAINVMFREYLARPRAVLDLYFMNVDPVLLDEKYLMPKLIN